MSPALPARALNVELPDIQSRADARQLAIDAVGIRGIRLPVNVRTRDGIVPAIATCAMSVALPPSARGTHMSRFVELLESQVQPLDPASFRRLTGTMLARLGAASGEIEMSFSCFLDKYAPVSGARSWLDYEVRWTGTMAASGEFRLRTRVGVPVTSLCPCSKEISSYGAHNQRSMISIEAESAPAVPFEDLIAIAERQASCELYGLLKRADEKHVTERAYQNPKFAEDLVRDVALELMGDRRIGRFTVEAENFESIHNHSAVARLTGCGPLGS
ncbi:MAG: GTP cyclohydrolase FolE2 [Gammaproteobacteria bacterium]